MPSHRRRESRCGRTPSRAPRRRNSRMSGPAADASAEDHLQRFALALVGAFVDEHRHRCFRLPFPEVPFEDAERHHAKSVEAHGAVVPFTDVPREDAPAVATGGRLGEGARTWNAALARVEPVALNAPFRNVCHSVSHREWGSGLWIFQRTSIQSAAAISRTPLIRTPCAP